MVPLLVTHVTAASVCPALLLQAFENMNKALKMSCTKGLPVRVVRSFKVCQGPSTQWRECSGSAAGVLLLLLQQQPRACTVPVSTLLPPCCTTCCFCLTPLTSASHLEEKRSNCFPPRRTPLNRHDSPSTSALPPNYPPT